MLNKPPVVYAGGIFDLFHAGHVRFFRRLSVYGRVHAVLQSDEFARRYKRPPIMSLKERLECVRACRYVSDCSVNEGDEDAKRSILRVSPDYIAHGNDWEGKTLLDHYGVTQEWLDEKGIQMLYVPYTNGVSTSDIIHRCLQL